MWERAYYQLRRHTGRLPGTGDSAQESICVQLLALVSLARSVRATTKGKQIATFDTNLFGQSCAVRISK